MKTKFFRTFDINYINKKLKLIGSNKTRTFLITRLITTILIYILCFFLLFIPLIFIKNTNRKKYICCTESCIFF